MGFHSWDCEGCGHPLLSPDATDYGVNAWMSNTVAVLESGEIVQGFYDGYGRVAPTRRETSGWDADGKYTNKGKTSIKPEPTVYHRACWTLLGEPADYRGESQGSADQGWNFDERDHRYYEPRDLDRMKAMRPHPSTPPADAPTFEVRDWRDGSNGPCRCCEGKHADCPFCEGACEDCDGTGFDPYSCEMCWDPIREGGAVVCADCGEAICEGHEAIAPSYGHGGAWGEDEWKAAHVHECRGKGKGAK